jgi:hypothetical protein
MSVQKIKPGSRIAWLVSGRLARAPGTLRRDDRPVLTQIYSPPDLVERSEDHLFKALIADPEAEGA